MPIRPVSRGITPIHAQTGPPCKTHIRNSAPITMRMTRSVVPMFTVMAFSSS